MPKTSEMGKPINNKDENLKRGAAARYPAPKIINIIWSAKRNTTKNANKDNINVSLRVFLNAGSARLSSILVNIGNRISEKTIRGAREVIILNAAE